MTESGQTATFRRRVRNSLFIGAGLLAAFLSGTWSLPRGGPSAAAPAEGWLPAGSGIAETISGLAVCSAADAEVAFLAVYDNKAAFDTPAVGPRLALLRRRGAEIHRQILPWPGAALPEDLEAITAHPTQPGIYFALTSKGKLSALTFNPATSQTTLIGESTVPNAAPTSEFEGFDVAAIGKNLIAVWADRGTPGIPARLSWSIFDPTRFTFAAVQSTDLSMPWPTANVRHVSDLKVDDAGTLFVSAASDPGNDGPFASAVYAAGVFFPEGDAIRFRANPRPARLYATDQHKIEALTFLPGTAGGLVLGSDDENRGAALLLPRP